MYPVYLHNSSLCTNVDDHILSINAASICWSHSFHQRTPLHIAVKEGYEHTVECIVENDADINCRDKKGVRLYHSLICTADLSLS